MNIFDDVSLLYTVAKYYYLYEYSQGDIAKLLNISRSQISRVLKRAGELEIVKIEVSMPNNLQDNSISEKIKKYLVLKDVLIVENSNDNKFLYVKSSEYLSNIIDKNKKIDIGWNETLYNISIELKYNDADKQKIFYPLIGNLRNIEKLYEFKKFWSDLDIALIGLSSKHESYKSYIIDIPAIDKLDINNIEGMILCNFFMNDGKTFEYPDKYYINCIMLSELKKIKNIICIVSGNEKADMIKLAAVNKYFNILITDQITANSIVSSFNL